VKKSETRRTIQPRHYRAGLAGLVAAHKAARLDVKVALIERDLLGGNCLNTGSVPSKTLIRTSRLYASYLTNETVFNLMERPNRLLVIGGGPTGCELAQAFCRLGSQITIVQDEPMFLSQEERDAAQILSAAFARDGIEIYLNSEIVAVRVEGASKLVELLQEDSKITVAGDEILLGAGQTRSVES
jgi:pyruvate/2-oxoglutarate dehydrogenase complex dihydrolipoamide dehydrogenase (E3) component